MRCIRCLFRWLSLPLAASFPLLLLLLSLTNRSLCSTLLSISTCVASRAPFAAQFPFPYAQIGVSSRSDPVFISHCVRRHITTDQSICKRVRVTKISLLRVVNDNRSHPHPKVQLHQQKDARYTRIQIFHSCHASLGLFFFFFFFFLLFLLFIFPLSSHSHPYALLPLWVRRAYLSSSLCLLVSFLNATNPPHEYK